jgi:MFS family permease
VERRHGGSRERCTLTVQPTFSQSLRALPRPAWILCLGSFVNKVGSFVLIFLVLYLTGQGYTIRQAGVAASAYGAGAIGAAFAGGMLADLLGRRNTIVVSMFSSAAAMLLLSQAEGFLAIAALAAMVGFTSHLYRPAASALLADLTPPGQRVAAFGVHRLAINAGAAVGPALGGLLSERSFFLLFAADAATSIAFGVLVLLALEPGGMSADAGEDRGSIRAIFSDRSFLILFVAGTLNGLVYVQAQSTLPLHVRDTGFSTAVYGGLIALNGLLVILLELPILSVAQRVRLRPVIALGFLFSGLGFGLTGLATSIPLLALTVAIWTLGEILNVALSSAYVADVSPVKLRGRYQGAWTATYAIALVVGPVLGTAVYAWRPAILWGACVLLGVVSALLVLPGMGRWKESRWGVETAPAGGLAPETLLGVKGLEEGLGKTFPTQE